MLFLNDCYLWGMHKIKSTLCNSLPYPQFSLDELGLICDIPLKLSAVSSAIYCQMSFKTGHLS